MTTENKLELLNALLKVGGHDRSITIKDKPNPIDLGYITVKVDFSMSQEIDVNLSEILSNTFSDNFSMSEIYELAGKIAGILDKSWDKHQDPIDTQISKKVIEMYKQIVLDVTDEIYDEAWKKFESEYLEDSSNLRNENTEMDFYHEQYDHGFNIEVTNEEESK